MNPTLLKDLILAGHRVACKMKDGYWKVFLHISSEWFFMWTLFDRDINISISAKLSNTIHTKYHISDNFTWEYKIVTPLPQLPQVWDTVEVLEICRELPDFDEWWDRMKDMVWWRFKVKSISYFWHIRVYTDFEKDYYTFTSRQVAKCEPDVEQSIVSEETLWKIIELNWKKYREII